jgi:hypothetical protein
MLGTGWLTVRQAQEALKNRRLEEAQRLLEEPGAQGHKGSWELLRQLARLFAERADLRLAHDDSEAAWDDLLKAEQVGGAEDANTIRLRQTLTRLGLAEVRALLEAGDPARALEHIIRLRERSVRQSELGVLDDAAREWTLARGLADRGEFSLASQGLEKVARLLHGSVSLERFTHDLNKRRDACGVALDRLHEAVAAAHWREVLAAAEHVLAAAPQHGEALNARLRAWKSLEPATTSFPSSHVDEPHTAPPDRFMLWVDGIGNYLVCLGTRVTFGQAIPSSRVDVPLLADVSRLHATLTRESEGYLLEAHRPTLVNASSVDKVLLQEGDRFSLGSSCQMTFSQPVPVSATARLDPVGGPRTSPAADAILLMAETLVLGSGPQAHVIIPELRQPVILYRQKDGLGVRHVGSLWVDGHRCGERGSLGTSGSVRGDDFSFAIEPACSSPRRQ